MQRRKPMPTKGQHVGLIARDDVRGAFVRAVGSGRVANMPLQGAGTTWHGMASIAGHEKCCGKKFTDTVERKGAKQARSAETSQRHLARTI